MKSVVAITQKGLASNYGQLGMVCNKNMKDYLKLFLYILIISLNFSCKEKNKSEFVKGKWQKLKEDISTIDTSNIYNIDERFIQVISNSNYSTTRKYKLEGDTIYMAYGFNELEKWICSFYVVEANEKKMTLQLFFGKELSNNTFHFIKIEKNDVKIDPKDDVRRMFDKSNLFDLSDSLTLDSLYKVFRSV